MDVEKGGNEAAKVVNAAATTAGSTDSATKWHALDTEALLSTLSATEEGLTKPEAAARLVKYGPNAMTKGKARGLLHMIWDQLANIITIILIVAAIIAGIFQEWIDLGFIVAVIFVNVILGVWMEGRAEAATKAISAMVSASALVLRNGRRVTVEARSLVPGDIIFLSSGDRIPADVRWLETSSLQVTEAMLTGESTPISKNTEPAEADAPLGDRTCMGFSGTLVFTGQGKAVVCATGDDAEIGHINQLMTSVKVAKTPLLQQVEGFGFALSVLCILVAIVTFCVAYWGRHMELKDAFSAAVSVAVALIPEGLPTVVTITLALGVQHMAAAHAIIRQLPAVETLGALTCICSDKTGTLTKNEMTAVGLHASGGAVFRVTGSGYNPDGDIKLGEDPLPAAARAALRQLLLPAVLCNDATLMPLVSAHAQNMLTTQAVTLPSNQLGLLPGQVPAALTEEGRASHLAAASAATVSAREPEGSLLAAHGAPAEEAAGALPPLAPDDPAAHLPKHLRAESQQVGVAITRAITVASRVVTWGVTGDPTEAALIALAMKSGLNLRTLNLLSQSAPRLATLPFSSENKFMATVHDLVHPETGALRRILLVKGAPDVLLPRCSAQAVGCNPWRSEPIELARWTAANAALSCEGLRVLALCWKELPLPPASAAAAAAAAAAGSNVSPTATDVSATVESGASATPAAAPGDVVLHSGSVLGGVPSLQLNCLVAIVDPPRDEAIKAVHSCHEAGITVKMITGDHADTARTIGGWIGIESAEVLTGPQLERMDEGQLLERVEGCNIYARASPEHKLRIVKALQRHGHVVAMTGDGVNDAPALRQANVGVAMGITGTEVAKEASRMLLLDDNFATIERAVLQGRRTYDNLRKLLAFLLPTSVAQGVSIAVAVFMGVPPPLNPVQILYVNMVTAATLGLVLAAEEPEPDAMQRPPRVQSKPLVGKLITWRSLFVGAEMIAAMLIQQQWTRNNGGSERAGTTVAMNTLVISQCLYCLACRSMKKHSFRLSAILGNPWLSAMILLNAALQCLITYAPGVQEVWGTEALGGLEWLRILMFAFIIFGVVEVEKALGPRFVRPVVMPCIRGLNAAMGCSRRRGPAPYRMRQTEMREVARSDVARAALERLPAPSAAGAGAGGAAEAVAVGIPPVPIVLATAAGTPAAAGGAAAAAGGAPVHVSDVHVAGSGVSV